MAAAIYQLLHYSRYDFMYGKTKPYVLVSQVCHVFGLIVDT